MFDLTRNKRYNDLFLFSVSTMTRYFNVDIDNIITDYELAYQNAYENFIDEIKRSEDNILKLYSQDIDKYSKTLSMMHYNKFQMYYR